MSSTWRSATTLAASSTGSSRPRLSGASAPLLIAGVFGGVAVYLLRRYTRGEHSELDESIWNGDGRLSFRRSLGTSVISEVVIGMGASMGREAAPKLLGGVSASLLATWTGLSAPQRRLLVACGGGAGLAAVYNVPLGGALFTAEILCGSISLPIMLPALACSGIATAVASIYLPLPIDSFLPQPRAAPGQDHRPADTRRTADHRT
jgi:chloride channel protein, CIC family